MTRDELEALIAEIEEGTYNEEKISPTSIGVGYNIDSQMGVQSPASLKR